MKYTLTIEKECPINVWDKIYVFDRIFDERFFFEPIENTANWVSYRELTVDEIKISDTKTWDRSFVFTYTVWTGWYSSDNFHEHTEWSFHSHFYSKEDAEKQKKQRQQLLKDKIEKLTKYIQDASLLI